MPDAAVEPTTADVAARRFGRTLLGYRRSTVDDLVTRLEGRVDDLEGQALDLREQLLEQEHSASETRHDLTRARAELRYWNDRASYVDSEVARARHRAVELERAARERADSIEANAQERSLQLVDRVCGEANAMLQAAREEAREMFLRFEVDVDMSQGKLDRLEQARTQVAEALQTALAQFEAAVEGVTSVAPARRIVELLEEPVRRARPTFGTERALEAARRFAEASDPAADAALSTPLPTALTGQVQDTDEDTAEHEFEHDLEDRSVATPSRTHDADDAFAALLASD